MLPNDEKSRIIGYHYLSVPLILSKGPQSQFQQSGKEILRRFPDPGAVQEMWPAVQSAHRRTQMVQQIRTHRSSVSYREHATPYLEYIRRSIFLFPIPMQFEYHRNWEKGKRSDVCTQSRNCKELTNRSSKELTACTICEFFGVS